jgi:outer membrane protein
MTHGLKTVLPLLLTLACTSAPAAAGEWGLGAAVAHFQPPQRGIEGEFLGVPYVSYRGERLTVDVATASFSLVESGSLRFSLEGELRFAGYEAADSPALIGMADRDPALDAGFGVSHRSRWGEVKAVILGDISGTHQGYEVRAQYRRPYLIERLLIAPGFGVSRLNNRLVDYYYGVRADEVGMDRPQYDGIATTNLFVELALAYTLSDRLELLGGMKYVWLGDAIEASPIVDRAYDSNAFAALQYKF